MSKEQELSLLASSILEKLNISEYKDKGKPKEADKREAKYNVGVELSTARNKFKADQDFGEWCRSHIIEKYGTESVREHKALSEKLRRYRQYPEFGTLDLCERVGFTNIYKLMEEKNKSIREWVKANHESFKTKKALGEAIKAKLKGEEPVEQQETPSIQVVGNPQVVSNEAMQSLQEQLNAMSGSMSSIEQRLEETLAKNAILEAENAKMKPIVEQHRREYISGKLFIGNMNFSSLNRLRSEYTDVEALKKDWKEFANFAHPDKETSKLLPLEFDLGAARTNYRARLKELQQ